MDFFGFLRNIHVLLCYAHVMLNWGFGLSRSGGNWGSSFLFVLLFVFLFFIEVVLSKV